MPLTRRPIPVLPERPHARPIASKLFRSYPVGRHRFSRAFSGREIELTVRTGDHFPADVQAALVTTINSKHDGDWVETPFARLDERTLVCRITPERPGFYAMRARFSLDGGSTWLRDPVPDAWVLVDPPQVDGMRQYTLIPSVSGSIADWADELYRIKEMGFNCVHLLPLTTLDTSLSPYAARDLFDIDAGYLAEGSRLEGLAQLEAFVEKAKSLEIQLCFDLVLNHVGTDSIIAQRVPDWIVPDQDSPDGFKRAQYFSEHGWLPWNDLVLINYEHPSDRVRSAICHYMKEYALFWGKYASYTNGFVRFDNLHSSDSSFTQTVARALRAEYPCLGIIAEYFTDNSTLLDTVPVWGLNLVLATPWNFKFVPQLREYLKHILSIAEQVRYYMPITSHDSGTPTQEFWTAESTIPRYVAAALMGTGATGITQGVEWAEKEKINFIGRHTKIVYPPRQRFAEFIRQVNQTHAQYPAFRMGQNCEFVDNNHHAVIAAFRKASGSDSAGFLVVCNFDVQGTQSLEINLSSYLAKPGPLVGRDLLSGVVKTFATSLVQITIEPNFAQVWMF